MMRGYPSLLRKNNKDQTRGRLNLIGRLQVATEKAAGDTNNEIAFLRELRTEVRRLCFQAFDATPRGPGESSVLPNCTAFVSRRGS